MSEARRTAAGPEAMSPRATEEDAVALARETFLADQRVDMNTLASELGIGRATLYRWVDTREDLLDRVLGRLAGEFFEPSRSEALTRADDIAPEMVRIMRRSPNPHQGFGGGGRHLCLGAGLARLELKLWIEETLNRFPDLALDGDSDRLASTFLNQYRSIPVALGEDRRAG